MLKNKYLLIACAITCFVGLIVFFSPLLEIDKLIEERTKLNPPSLKKKSIQEKSAYNTQRYLYEFYRQANTQTGRIPKEEKLAELNTARNLMNSNSYSRNMDMEFRSRGPSNFGGRTRAVVIDRSDPSENTMLAGAVSGGVFRTTNGGENWTKVSPNDAIHNATTIVQDPRAGFENIWYYGTGEFIGNSASLNGAIYRGQGIWKSTDSGVTWAQIPSTDSQFEIFDSEFDYIFRLVVHPSTGDLYAACLRSILRFDGTDWNTEISDLTGPINGNQSSDIVVTNNGRVYAALGGGNTTSIEGIWTSESGIGNWTRINTGSFTPSGRVVLSLAPSNQNKLYCLFDNGTVLDSEYFQNGCQNIMQEVDLWQWNQLTTTFTNYSNKLPYEGGCTLYNDPFTTYLGYTMSLGVKPDNENFVVIGATNAYRIEDITNASQSFNRIGGYLNANSYFIYDLLGDEHHPDMHSFVFSASNPNIMYSASDGGIHKTSDIRANTVSWINLNNNFQTYQYYHVSIDPEDGSDLVIGGTQDNGTKVGGTQFELPGFPIINDLTTHAGLLGGDGVATAISRDGCNGKPVYFMGFQFGTIYRLCDDYDLITPLGSTSEFVSYFYLDPSNNNALYYAGENRLYRTIDSRNVTPNTWDNLGTSSLLGHSDKFQRFSTSKGNYNSNSYLLLGGDRGHIYRLDDPQNTSSLANAIDITPSGATTGFPSIVTGLAVHPTNNDIVMATYSNYGNPSIFLTENATSNNPTWTLIERNLSSHSIRSAAIIELDGETIFIVGTARGLYSSIDPNIFDWEIEAPEELGIPLISDLDYRESDGHLLIGTHGNGMYESIPSQTLSYSSSSLNTISIYPNPVKNQLNVVGIDPSNSNATYKIYDINGKELMNGKLSQKKIEVSNLTQGLYFLNLKSQLKTYTIKFFRN